MAIDPRCRRVAAGLSAVALAGLLLAPAIGFAAEPAARAALPSDLDLVPRNAAGFLHVRTAELWKTDMMADLRHIIKQAGPEALAAFENKCPVAPEAIDRLTFIMTTPKALAEPFPSVDPEAVSALVVVHTTKPYARIALMQALGYREKVYRREVYHFNEEMWSGLYLVDDQTFLVGSEDALIQYLDLSRREGPLQPALEIAAGKHHGVLGLNPGLLAKENGMQLMPAPLQPLLEARCATLTIDLDKVTRLDLRLDYAKEEQAKAGEKAVREALVMARAGLAIPVKEMEDQLYKDPAKAKTGIAHLPENFGALLAIGFLRELDTMMKNAVVEQKGASVHLPAQFSKLYSGNSSLMVMWVGALGLGWAAYGTFSEVGPMIGGPNQKDPNEEHLRKLVDAMERFRQDKGAYPSAATHDKDGRPLLSWRVALLPYLGEEALHREFRLDEPWDSLHNKKLIKKLPKCLTSQNYYSWRSKRGKTTDFVFTGVNTVFEGKQGVRKEDVAAKTILVIQAGGDHGVYWTKPADLIYRADKPLPELFDRYGGQVRVVLVDGTYRTFQKGAEDKALQDLIPRKKKEK